MIVSTRHLVCAAALAALLSLVKVPGVLASGTASWEMDSYTDFVRGRFDGVSLSRDGRLSLAPKLETVFSSDQAVVWSVAEAPDGTLYAATGHRGRVYRIDRAGKVSLLWTAEQPEVFAITVDRAGIVYVGTGDQGKIFRVGSAGKGELYYETGQSHITGLAIDTQGRLLAGTEPNGLLYRITAKDKAFVLYDSSLPEVRAILPMPDGSVYAAALGGSVAKRLQNSQQATQGATTGSTVNTPITTITVEAQQSGPGPELKPSEPNKPSQQPPAPTPQVTTQFTPVTDVTGVEKSAVYRINPDNTVETLWSSKEENVYDLLALDRQLVFSTDENGRIYSLAPDRRVTLLLETRQGETTRLLPSDHSVLAATGNMGRIFRLGETPGSSGWYEAPVHDAGTASRWGSLSWRAEVPAGSSVQFRTRSGNSAKPDRTWSDWSEPLTNAAGSRVSSPNARYIEWKAEMTGSGGATPSIVSVSLAYLPQNSPPVIRNISVTTQAVASSQPAKSSSSSAYTVTVTDTSETATSAGTPTQTLPRATTQQITVSWQADDPDGDRLVYN